MHKFLSVIALGAALSFNVMAQPAAGAAPAPATAPAKTMPAAAPAAMAPPATNKAPTAQQSKMGTCNADAKTKALKGDERKAFMQSCLSAGSTTTAATGKTTQQEKMKTCNTDAKTKTLKGDDRKTFMKSCLSSAPAA